MRNLRRLFVSCLVLGLLGCGGGGGADSGSPLPADAGPDSSALDGPADAPVQTDGPGAADGPAGDGGGDDVIILPPDDGGTETDTPPLAPIVREGVRVLPDDGSLTIAAVTETSVTLRGSMPVMNAGDVLVSGQGEGLARRVVSISTSGADTIITTQPAALTDIFQQGELALDRMFEPDDVSPQPAVPGMESGETVLPLIVQPWAVDPLAVTWLTLPFDHAFLDRPQGKVRLHGSAGVGLGLEVKVEIEGFGLRKLRVVPSVHGQLRANLVAQLSARSTNHRLPLGGMNFKSFTVSVGPVPVVLTPSLDLYAVSNLDVQAGANMTLGLDALAKAGFEWRPGTVKPIIENNLNATFGVEGAARVSGDLSIRPELSIKVYGVRAAYAGVDLPHLTATVASSGTGLSVYAAARLRAGAGFVPGIFGPGGGGYWNLLSTDPFVITSGDVKVLHNAVVDFSTTRNPNGNWSYGWVSAVGQPFQRYTRSRVDSALPIAAWTDPARGDELSVFFNQSDTLQHPAGTVNLEPRQLGLHPGPAGEISVVRFTPTVGGTYRIGATFKGLSGYGGAPPTTTFVAVAKDGAVQNSGTLNHNGGENAKGFYFDIALSPGTPLDFLVGGSNGDHRWDSTGLHVEAVLQ